MIRTTAILLAAMFVAGCQSTTTPRFNPLAAYGKTTVAPPATGAYGAPNSYYQQQSQSGGLGAAAGSTMVAAAGEAAPSAASPSLLDSETGTALGSGVQPASYLAPVSGGNERVRVVESAAATDSQTAPLQLRGMPVSDATAAAPPALFVPQGAATNVSRSPQSAAAGPLLRIRGLPSEGADTSESAGRSGTAARIDALPTVGAGQWQSRYKPEAPLSVSLARQ